MSVVKTDYSIGMARRSGRSFVPILDCIMEHCLQLRDNTKPTGKYFLFETVEGFYVNGINHV